MLEFLTSLAGATVLCLSTWLCYRRRRSLLGPEVVLGISWIMYLLLTAFVGIGYYVSPISISVLVAGILAFQFSASLVRMEKADDESHKNASLLLPRLCLIIGVICGLIGLQRHLASGGITLSEYGAADFTETAARVAAKQYARDGERLGGTIVSKLLTSLMLASSYIGGMYRITSPGRRHNNWLALLLGVGLLSTAMTTTRSAFFMVLLNYLCGCAAGAVFCRVDGHLRASRTVTIALLFSPLLVAVLVIPALIRWRSDTAEMGEAVDKLRIWGGGYISAFCVWYDDYYAVRPEAYRNAMLLPCQVQLGLSDTSSVEELTEPYSLGYRSHQSNAATIFKALIGQFGTMGAIVVMGIMGFVSAITYKASRCGNVLAAGILSVIYAIVLFSGNGFFFHIGRRTFPAVVFIAYCIIGLRGSAQGERGQVNSWWTSILRFKFVGGLPEHR